VKDSSPLISTLAEDPALRPLVEAFVDDLPRRLAGIERALADANVSALKRLIHQLRGSAGGYGFAPITEAAASIEREADAGADVARLRASVDALAALCRRAAVAYWSSSAS
jgi:HPt (histidine-containing phosphotransfer) domain-containing protein